MSEITLSESAENLASLAHDQNEIESTFNCLSAKLKELNDKTRAWVAEDSKNRWAGMLCEDLKHWAEYGIFTGAELEHYLLVSNAFEAWRDAHGYKYSWKVLDSMSKKELEYFIENI